MKYRVTDEFNGVSVVSDTDVQVDHAGVYNLQFSAQFEKSSANAQIINIWLRKNGSNLDWTNTVLTMDGSASR